MRSWILLLNQVEDGIEKKRQIWVDGEDIQLWKQHENKFSNKLSPNNTWEQLRETVSCSWWSTSVWFTYGTPKFTFILWLAIQNRLTTGDLMERWNANINTQCSLCHATVETWNHLFFSCQFSAHVKRPLMRGIVTVLARWTLSNVLSQTFSFKNSY